MASENKQEVTTIYTNDVIQFDYVHNTPGRITRLNVTGRVMCFLVDHHGRYLIRIENYKEVDIEEFALAFVRNIRIKSRA